MAWWRAPDGRLNWACFIWFYAGCMMTLRGVTEHDLILGVAGTAAFVVALGFALNRAWATWLMLLLACTLFAAAIWRHQHVVYMREGLLDSPCAESP